MKIAIDWSDGRYSFIREPESLRWTNLVDVPESTVAMWEAAARLDAEVQSQLRTLDEGE